MDGMPPFLLSGRRVAVVKRAHVYLEHSVICGFFIASFRVWCGEGICRFCVSAKMRRYCQGNGVLLPGKICVSAKMRFGDSVGMRKGD
jgi:hypothetical protein